MAPNVAVSEAAATFWNQRYRDHSACWGDAGSPTLQVALKHFPATGRALEIGYGQQPAIHSLLADTGFTSIEFTPDLQGIPRVAVGQRP